MYNNNNKPCGKTSPTGSDDTEYIQYYGGLVFQQSTYSGGSPSYFDFYGDFYAGGSAYKSGGGSWSDSSDQRLKKNISDVDSKTALDKLTSLQVKEYQWINPDAHANDTGVHAAVMAQDLQKVFPDWVTKTDPIGADKDLLPSGDKALNVGYPNDFNAYLISALQELKKQNEELRTQSEKTQTDQQVQINELKKALEALKK